MEGDNLYRLRDRKFLLEDKKRLCALALGTAVLGIVLMIIHAETCPFIDKPVGRSELFLRAAARLTKCLIFLKSYREVVPGALTDDCRTSSVHFCMHSEVIAIFLKLKQTTHLVFL